VVCNVVVVGFVSVVRNVMVVGFVNVVCSVVVVRNVMEGPGGGQHVLVVGGRGRKVRGRVNADGPTCGLFVLDGRRRLRSRRNIAGVGNWGKRRFRGGGCSGRWRGRRGRHIAGFVGMLRHGILTAGGEDLLAGPQLLARQWPSGAPVQGAGGVINVGRAHCCLPLSEDGAVSAAVARTVSSAPPAPRSTVGDGAVTREPTSAPLAFCMSMAC